MARARLLFFRLCSFRLARLPFPPLLVFVGDTASTKTFQALDDVEPELAHLDGYGIIDAVLIALVFGPFGSSACVH